MRLLADIDEGEDIVAVFVYRAGRQDAGRGERRARLCRAQDEYDRQDAQGQGAARRRSAGQGALRRAGRGRPCRDDRREPQAAVFPLAKCPKWRAARACGCSAIKDGGLADVKTFALGRRIELDDPAGRGSTCRGDPLPNGSATAPKPAACRPRVFRRATNSVEVRLSGRGRRALGLNSCPWMRSVSVRGRISDDEKPLSLLLFRSRANRPGRHHQLAIQRCRLRPLGRPQSPRLDRDRKRRPF